MEAVHDVLIVGSGHAGAQTAIALRQLGFQGSVAIATDELELPYERPPLSKDYLTGERPFERMLIRPGAFWAQRQIAIFGGRRIVSVDPEAKAAEAADGTILRYGRLVWAAGGTPRRLPGAEGLANVRSVRTKGDTDVITEQARAAEKIVIVGGGYIGLEAASALRQLGRRIVLLEAADRVLARVSGESISRFFEAEHRARGVDVRTGVAVSELIVERGRVSAVRLGDGELIPADLVIVGIGITPAVGPLIEAGALASDGVDVDELCRTSLPDIFAIGDCAAHANRFAGGSRIRLESVQNATDQGNVVARLIVGQATPYAAVPWFWSHQYDLKLQSVGLAAGHDMAIVRGDPGSRCFSVIYLKQKKVVALDCVNATKDYVQGRKLVEQMSSAPIEKLTDSTLPLKDIVADT